MFTIYHDFIINTSKEKVFEAVSTPEGLNNWWTLNSKGNPALGETFNLYFGEEYDWYTEITKFSKDKEIEFKTTIAMQEWLPTSFGFKLTEVKPSETYVRFYHKDWTEISQEYRQASFCWADLLRQMKQYLEKGIITPFEQRS
ncbi:SRPBCC domain-containing protein [Flavobacterium sp.]|uniref:SRPBCC family protein n=1 Tax=Flavobacterium sp. TaxID=239 RepID=UPI0028BD2C43|nr:SRPBCC domain-containing protein [Flavobacterium sp.]